MGQGSVRVREMIGETQFGGGVDNPRHPIAGAHLDQLGMGWQRFGSSFTIFFHVLSYRRKHASGFLCHALRVLASAFNLANVRDNQAGS